MLPETVYDFVDYMARFDHDNPLITHEDEVEFEKICNFFQGEDALSVFADPACAEEAGYLREKAHLVWSRVNSVMEDREVWDLRNKALTYEAFCDLTARHWLTTGSQELVQHELALLKDAGAPKARCCMIGPGALPYTGLSFVADGYEHVDLVDMLDDALTWSSGWMEQYFPEASVGYVCRAAEDHDYTGYDVVIVASMLFNKPAILKRIAECGVPYVLVRTTQNHRPRGVLIEQMQEKHLKVMDRNGYACQGLTNPPAFVAHCTLLYAKAA